MKTTTQRVRGRGLLGALAGGLAGVAMLLGTNAWAADTGKGFMERWGMSMAVGGGLTGFTSDAPSEIAEVGGNWEARFAVGSRRPVAVEAAYLGAAQGVDSLGVESDAVLVATGLESALRFNLLTGDITPYAVAGIGWRHYEVSGAVNERTSSVRDTDDVLETPLGAGFMYRLEPVILDVRGVFRPAFDSDLIAPGVAQNKSRELHNWSARISLGWEL